MQPRLIGTTRYHLGIFICLLKLTQTSRFAMSTINVRGTRCQARMKIEDYIDLLHKDQLHTLFTHHRHLFKKMFRVKLISSTTAFLDFCLSLLLYSKEKIAYARNIPILLKIYLCRRILIGRLKYSPQSTCIYERIRKGFLHSAYISVVHFKNVWSDMWYVD